MLPFYTLPSLLGDLECLRGDLDIYIMYREILIDLSATELHENINRLKQAIDDLYYCLSNLIEEKDELKSSNAMYKDTISALSEKSKTPSKTIAQKFKFIFNRPSSQLKNRISKIVEEPLPNPKNSKSERSTGLLEISQFTQERPKDGEISQTISEEISLPKDSKPKKQINLLPLLENYMKPRQKRLKPLKD